MTHSVTREIILLLLFFSSHLHDKVKILCIFKTLIRFISSEYWFHCCFIDHIRIILSRFCNTLPLTYERSYQSFDKVAIQIFWHHLLIKMRPGLVLGSHWSWTCITLQYVPWLISFFSFDINSHSSVFTQMGPCYTSLFVKGKILQSKVQCLQRFSVS